MILPVSAFARAVLVLAVNVALSAHQERNPSRFLPATKANDRRNEPRDAIVHTCSAVDIETAWHGRTRPACEMT
jgi:hypothetical protein